MYPMAEKALPKQTESPDISQLLPLIMQTGLLNIPPPVMQMLLQKPAPQPTMLNNINAKPVNFGTSHRGPLKTHIVGVRG